MRTKTVPSPWLRREGRRLDVGPYMSGALEAKVRLEEMSVRKDRLDELTAGHKGGIFNGPQFSRTWVDDPEYGVPFVGSSSMLMADLSNLPLLRKKNAESSKLSYLRLSAGMTLISCSGTIGRMVYVRPDMEGIWSSQDIMKVAPDPEKVPPGYLYAYLSSKFGVPLVVSGTYGAIIQHIEPHHIAGLPVPRLGKKIEQRVHELVEEAAEKRKRAQILLNTATSKLLDDAGIEEQPPQVWHSSRLGYGFPATLGPSRTLRASNYMPRVRRLVDALGLGPSVLLGEICRSGYLNTGARFRRIDADPEFGVRLVGQKQGFWMFPPGRWISAGHAPKGIFAEDETVMIASSGTLGEHELYCRALLITGRWLNFVYTQHFLRVVSGDERFTGAYLFAFLRSNLAFRILRAYSTGSKQQEIHLALLSRLPIPLLTDTARHQISTTVRQALLLRDEADEAEIQARSLVEQTIEAPT